MSTDDRDLQATSPIEVPEEDTMTMPLAGAATPVETPAGATTELPTEAPTGATTSGAGPTATAAVATTAPAPLPQQKAGIRVGTVVWGLVIAAIGALIMAYALGVSFDAELAFIVLLAAAGVLLLVGSLVTSRHRR